MTGIKVLTALAFIASPVPAVAVSFDVNAIVAAVVSLIFAALAALVAKQIAGIEDRLKSLELLPERVARLEERTSSPGEGRKR